MAKIYLPTDGSIGLLSYEDGPEFNVQTRTSRAMRATTRTLPGTRWRAQLTFAPFDRNGFVGRGRLEAFLTSLRGGGNELVVWHPNKPEPLGTLRTNTTTAAAAAANSNSITLNATTGLTLLRGDRLGLHGTIYMAVADATSASGQMAVTIEPALRQAVAMGDAVVLQKPTLSLLPTDTYIGLPYQGAMAGAVALAMVEP